MSVSAVISIMLKLIPQAQKEQLSTAVCRSNHKVFPLAEAAEHKDRVIKYSANQQQSSVWLFFTVSLNSEVYESIQTTRVENDSYWPASEAGGSQIWDFTKNQELFSCFNQQEANGWVEMCQPSVSW